MACKELHGEGKESALKIKREDLEKDLEFAGFLVAYCPLKPDSKMIIQELKDSKHEVKIITGDNAMTAIHVGQELGFGPDKS